MRELVWFFVLKQTWNRFKENFFQIIILIFVLLGVLILPNFLFGLPDIEVEDILIEQRYLFINFYALVLAAFFYKIGSQSGEDATPVLVPKNIRLFVELVPNKFRVFIILSQIDKVIRQTLFFSMINVFWGLWFNVSLAVIGLRVLLLFLLVVFMSLLSSLLPSIIAIKGVKIISRIVSLIVAVSITFFALSGILAGTSYLAWEYSPQSILGNAMIQLISETAGVKSIWGTVQELLIYCMLLGMVTFLVTKSVEMSSIYEQLVKTKKFRSSKHFHIISNSLFFLPRPWRLIISRELIQIFIEKKQFLISIFFVLAIIGIMFGSAILVATEILYFGLLIAISYIAFMIGLTSLPREGKSIWILQTAYPKWKTISFCKYIACYLASLVMGIFIVFVYYLLMYKFLPEQIHLPLLWRTIFWGLFATQPLSLALGLIVGSLVTHKVSGKGFGVQYNFSGLEGAFIVLQIWLVAVPSALTGHILGGPFGEPVDLILKIIYAAYSVILIMVNWIVLSRKIRI